MSPFILLQVSLKLNVFLKLESFPEQHTGEIITKKVDSLIKENYLEKITHTWTTTDDGSNVVKAMCLSKGINVY